MTKTKSQNQPKLSFLISFTLCSCLFWAEWTPVVQAGIRPLYGILMSIGFSIIGVAAFAWSYKIAQKNKSNKWCALCIVAIVAIAGWQVLIFLAFAVGAVIGPALNNGFSQLSLNNYAARS